MKMAKWMDEAQRGEEGICPVCRSVSIKERGGQTGCGSKACRDKAYKLRQAGVDPKTASALEAMAVGGAAKPEKPAGAKLNGGEYRRFSKLQSEAGNPVKTTEPGGYRLSCGSFVGYADARSLALPILRSAASVKVSEAVAAAQGASIDQMLLAGRSVNSVVAAGYERDAVQSRLDFLVVHGRLPGRVPPPNNGSKPAQSAPPAKPVTKSEARVAIARVVVAQADADAVSAQLAELEDTLAEQRAALEAQAAQQRERLQLELEAANSKLESARSAALAMGIGEEKL